MGNISLCILCLKEKSVNEFNEEHIFPASIGGSIKVHNVCIECNSYLGKHIDTPLINHPLISYYRNVFSLGRDNYRKNYIPNPLRGVHQDQSGRKFTIGFKNGKFMAQPLVSHTVIYDEERKGHHVKLTVPEDQIDDVPRLIERIIKQNNLPDGNYTLENKELIPPSGNINVTVEAENNDLIFGCLKIAYESTVNLFPNYIIDPYSELYRYCILKKSFNHRLKKIIEKAQKLLKSVGEIEITKQLQKWHYFLLYKNIKGVGLVCFVRIFDCVYPVILSQNFRVMDYDANMLIVVDALTKSFFSNIQQSFPSIDLTLEFANIPPATCNYIIENGNKAFQLYESDCAIFTKFGEELNSNIFGLATKKLSQPDYYSHWLTSKVFIDLSQDSIFIKTLDGVLVKVLAIDVQRKVEVLKLK